MSMTAFELQYLKMILAPGSFPISLQNVTFLLTSQSQGNCICVEIMT